MSDVNELQAYDDDDIYNPTQEKLLTIIPMISSFVSSFCSALIIKEIWTKRTDLLPQVYHRIIFIISVLDVITSLNAMNSSFMVPRGSPDVFWAFGNTTTCDINGFLWQISYVIPLYNAALSFYFVLRVRYQVQDYYYAKYLEPLVHIVCGSYAVVSSILGLLWTVYNPSRLAGGWCIVGSFPDGCEGNECTRGRFHGLFVHAFFSPTFFVIFLSLIVNMVILYVSVRNQERRLHRYNSMREMRLSKKVGLRGIKFILAFLLTHTWQAWVFQFGRKNKGTTAAFVFILLMKTLVPLQGFWAYLIYFERQIRMVKVPFLFTSFGQNTTTTREMNSSAELSSVGSSVWEKQRRRLAAKAKKSRKFKRPEQAADAPHHENFPPMVRVPANRCNHKKKKKNTDEESALSFLSHDGKEERKEEEEENKEEEE